MSGTTKSMGRCLSVLALPPMCSPGSRWLVLLRVRARVRVRIRVRVRVRVWVSLT